MDAFLKMLDGARIGSEFLLNPTGETLVGRGLECQVVLTDAQCSRIHASIYLKDGQWWIRDADSRNGTSVNDNEIGDTKLNDGDRVQLGSTVFQFHTNRGNVGVAGVPHVTQTLVTDEQIKSGDTGDISIAALRDPQRAHDFLTLYRLSIDLLGCDDPDDVVRLAIEKLQERTEASRIGFLWTSDDGQLKPKLVIPQHTAKQFELSQSLTDLVCQERRAVRIDNQVVQQQAESLRGYADSICVPLIQDESTLGAIHLYREEGRFRDSDFQLAKSLANILVVALVRARRRASLEVEHVRLSQKSGHSDELLGESKPMTELKTMIGRIAHATGCVLICGESGVGKELVARALHRSSPRADRPMLSVNCAAITANLIESQLFGHVKGAFTSADKDHVGLFEQADSGTLFLDEVGEMTLEGQAKLLRIMEGHPFQPVGGSKEITVDVRVLAATNRDLREFVAEKKFREDLYYRLSVFELVIPPLRRRDGDLELLINHFLNIFKTQHGRPNLGLTDSARQKLLDYSWPGNIRQLRNVLDSAVVMCAEESIGVNDLGLHDAGDTTLDSLRIDQWEPKLIREALARTEGNVPQAADLVGLSRATLYRKLEEYGIDRS